MIAALVYTCMYLYFGVMTVRFLLPRHRPLNRIWLGMSLGLLEEMWLPAIGAFFISFGAEAHVFGGCIAFALTAGCWFLRDQRDPAGWDEKEDGLLKQLLIFGIPMTLLGIWLQYTHVMRVDAAGNWNVGQSTYGDLPMHLSFITGLVGKKLPADYPFFPGARLSYPFLTDSLSSTFYLMGCSLQAATIIPAVLMMALCYMGVMVLARDMTSGKKTALLAAALFFMNGGLGFLYDFDMAGSGTWTETQEGVSILAKTGQTIADWFSTVSERVANILTGYYKTPTNQPNPNNLRWSNVICDMMVPQRTSLGGWCMVIPCFYLLGTEFRARLRDPENRSRGLVLLGVWAGALPLIHTHSFLALGLASLGAMCHDMLHGDPKALPVRRPRWRILLRYLAYAAIAAALAAPQLFCFTFTQTFRESSRSFLSLQFNWVNNPDGTGMRDLYLWFYIKNIGLPFLALIAALFEKNPRNRRIFAMAVPIILAAEFVRFQPNEYDNNKLFYLAWLLCCMIVADWCSRLWKKLEGLGGRRVLAAAAAVITFLSAGLTIWRECVSSYVAFGSEAVEAGQFARQDTEGDAVFITGTQHLNPILSIAGRTIVCGPDLWLYWHGFDGSVTGERHEDLAAFYEAPEEHPEIPEKYGASYVYVSSYERGDYDVDEEGLARIGIRIFENGEASIYRLVSTGENQNGKNR